MRKQHQQQHQRQHHQQQQQQQWQQQWLQQWQHHIIGIVLGLLGSKNKLKSINLWIREEIKHYLTFKVFVLIATICLDPLGVCVGCYTLYYIIIL